jgi:cytochrome P450
LREDNEHFGFGSGIHTCFGGALARLEVNLALETFLRRVESPGSSSIRRPTSTTRCSADRVMSG